MSTLVDYAPMDPRHEWPHDYPADAPYALTETHYFGCFLPALNLDCEIYVWYHPALKMVSAGIFMFSKWTTTPVASEYFDYQLYLPWPKIDDKSIRFANGLELWIDQPWNAYAYAMTTRGKKPRSTCSILR